jgi:ribosome maturation factor RimP
MLHFGKNYLPLPRKFKKEEGFLIPLFVFKVLMEDLKTKINGWIQEYIGDGPIFLVDLSISKGLKRSLVIILVDTMEGITIDACALMSRKLAHHIEENLWIEEAYNLEVSSPGLDFPLTQGWQFEKNAGRTVKVWLKDGETAMGTLQGHTADSIQVLTEKTVKHRKVVAKEPTVFGLQAIDKIRVQVSFQ